MTLCTGYCIACESRAMVERIMRRIHNHRLRVFLREKYDWEVP